MPVKSRIQLAEQEIVRCFNAIEKKVFMKKNLYQVLAENHRSWELRKTMSVDSFIEHLKEMQLKEIILTSPTYSHKTFTRYIWGKEVSIYQLGLSLRPNSYISHNSAMYLHGLIDKMPSTIYVNTEQSAKPLRDATLEQASIDKAFAREPRTSNYIFLYDDRKICCLNGVNTRNLGVKEIVHPVEGKLMLTSIERTLIDIAVRPVYSGGCKEVLVAYKKAKDKVSVDEMLSMFKKINYAYPYHQAIGFYMQMAGFDNSILNKLKKLGIKYDFYLDYAIKQPIYSKEWRLYYPHDITSPP